MVHKAEILWRAPPRGMKNEGWGICKDSASASTSSDSSSNPQSERIGTACALLDVIAFMDVPVNSLELVTLLDTPLKRDARARGDKRAHPSAFDAVASKKLNAGSAWREHRSQPVGCQFLLSRRSSSLPPFALRTITIRVEGAGVQYLIPAARVGLLAATAGQAHRE